MTAHDHTTLTEGCYRCDLNRDEIEGYAATCRVTIRGVVHDPDCSHVNGPCSNTMPWVAAERTPDDRACKRCLPDGLPLAVSA